MEVHLNPELQSKLCRLAADQGRDTGAVVEEAVERFVDHDCWFSQEVDKGVAAAERGDFVEHEAVREMIGRRYPG